MWAIGIGWAIDTEYLTLVATLLVTGKWWIVIIICLHNDIYDMFHCIRKMVLS